jgi:hypothetical protein
MLRSSLRVALLGFALISSSLFVNSSTAEAKVIDYKDKNGVWHHKTSVLGAYSNTYNRFRGGHRYEFHTHVSDTIRDGHYSVYVRYDIQFRTYAAQYGEVGWIQPTSKKWAPVQGGLFRRIGMHYRYQVNNIDGSWNEVGERDLGFLFDVLPVVTEVRYKVSTCENIRFHPDRCDYYLTKSRKR